MKTYTLITGGSSGIGYELAKLFANDKHNLILVAKNEKKLKEKRKELLKQYDVEIITIAKDLSNKNEVEQLFNETSKYQVDYLINNAGFGKWGEFIELEWKEQVDMINLNITTLTHLAYHYGNLMKKNKFGFILNIASVAALTPSGPYLNVYFATKKYVLSFSQSLAYELKDYNVNVSALCPPATKTEFANVANLHQSPVFAPNKMADPVLIARKGYAGLMKKKWVIKPTFSVRFNGFITNHLPRKLIAQVIAKMNGIPNKH